MKSYVAWATQRNAWIIADCHFLFVLLLVAEVITVQLVVADGGLLGITQQMSRIGGQLALGPAGLPGSGVDGSVTGQQAVAPGTDIHLQHHEVPCSNASLFSQVGEDSFMC